MRRSLHSRNVVLTSGVADATVVLEGERIADVIRGASADPSLEVIELGDAWLLPGLVDTHVHINEPGRTEWEGFATATRAAAAGGITTVIDMPLNCIPVTTSRAALDTKLEACAPSLWVDCGFWGGAVPGNAGELAGLAEGGVFGAKAFLCDSGIDDFQPLDAAGLETAMRALARAGLPLLAHAELVTPVAASEGPPQRYATYLASRPASWEEQAIALLIELCRATSCRVHIVHLSAASALGMLAAARGEGLPISIETCPHYLCLSAEEVGEGATEFKCAPPIRERTNREALWQGLRDGVIDFVVSDHSPCTPELKGKGDFLGAWGGIASLQLGLCSVWSEARGRGFDVSDVVRWMSTRPASLFGLSKKGAIAPGKDADFVVFDPDGETPVTETMLHHRHRLTPYLGRRLAGRVRQTWLRGAVVFSDDGFGERRGKVLLRGGDVVRAAGAGDAYEARRQ